MTEDGEKKKKDLVITKHTGLPFDCDLYDRSPWKCAEAIFFLEAGKWSIDGRSRLQKRKYEGTACTGQKGKGRCLCDRCPSGSCIPASNLCDVKPILPLYDRSVAETVSAGKMDTG